MQPKELFQHDYCCQIKENFQDKRKEIKMCIDMYLKKVFAEPKCYYRFKYSGKPQKLAVFAGYPGISQMGIGISRDIPKIENF